jgi:hypothetical protein
MKTIEQLAAEAVRRLEPQLDRLIYEGSKSKNHEILSGTAVLERKREKMNRIVAEAIHEGMNGAMASPAGPIVREVLDELGRATTKFPTWPTDALHAFAVIGEEAGELQKEVLQLTYEPHKSSEEAVRKEAIQLAAVSLRFLMSLERYAYQPRRQHRQHS